MKYIITEEQHNRINEITVYKGGMDVRPIYKDIIEFLNQEISNKKRIEAVKYYVKNVLGYPEKFKNKKAKEYDAALDRDWLDDIPEQLKKPEVLSNIAYFLMNKFFKLQKFGELEYYVEHNRSNSNTYWFFDPELEIVVGYITCSQQNIENEHVEFPYDSWVINTAAVDVGLSGRGYGKQMYLAIIDDVDVLFSDNYLYMDSLNIWVNILPKYVYVGAYLDDEKPKRITAKSKVLKHEFVKRYFATKNPKLIKVRGSDDDDD